MSGRQDEASGHWLGTWHCAQHVVALNRVPVTVIIVSVIPPGPQSLVGGVENGLSLCCVKCPMSTLHPIPTPSSVGQKVIPLHLGPPCPQSQPELYTVELTKLITAGLGIRFLRRHFSRGKNTQEL